MLIKLWCAHVTEIPEVNKIMVFNSGILNGLNTLIPVGGQVSPNSIVVLKLEWKNVQKKEIKKNTSDVINRIIPNFSPIVTWLVWSPWKVPSRVMSRHHWYIISSVIMVLIKKRSVSFKVNILIAPENKVNEPIAPNNGHGL